MKTGLPVILGIAWAPIIWIIVMSTVQPILLALTGSWVFTQVAIIILVMLVMLSFLKYFMGMGRKIHTKSHDKA